jgi:AcrR family transcriptional regulator
MSAEPSPRPTRQRVPAAERRDALISAAVHHFARGGLHGTPVERIAREVGVAQPYVFSLFPTKRDLFLAAVERGYQQTKALFDRAAAEFEAGRGPDDCEDVLKAMGYAYQQMLASDRERDWLMLQHQAFAACHDEQVRERVRELFADLALHAQRLSGAEPERLDEFFRYGMSLNAAAALRVEDLSVTCEWVSNRMTAAQAPAE